MVTMKTMDTFIWSKDRLVADIVAEYQATGKVVIWSNHEGQSNEVVGLYELLDYVVSVFDFNKANITIVTSNSEEQHPEYQIRFVPSMWWDKAYTDFKTLNLQLADKDVTKNLFACFYNRPNWDRLAILNYVRRHVTHESMVAYNPSKDPHAYNYVDYNSVAANCRDLLDEIVQFSDKPVKLPIGHIDKELFNAMDVCVYYSDFFVEVVAETYITGLTFFPTEKTIRPLLCKTPFIAQASQGFLSNLKARYGFKTFDRWWDESYDQCQGYERVRKIFAVMAYLDKLTDQEKTSMYADMKETLAHNSQLCEEICIREILNEQK